MSEPVKINRRDRQSFVLMSEQIYEHFRNEISSLQRRLLGMNEIIDGKTKPLVRGENSRDLESIRKEGHQTAKRMKLNESDVEKIVRAGRR